jgi:hypothetical protein
VLGTELGELGAEVPDLPLSLGAGALLLLEGSASGRDLFLGSFERHARLLQVATEVRYLLLQALDQGSRRLNPSGELVYLIPRFFAHLSPFRGVRRATRSSWNRVWFRVNLDALLVKGIVTSGARSSHLPCRQKWELH